MTPTNEHPDVVADPDAADHGVRGVPSDNDSLTGVLSSMREDGYPGDLRPSDDQGNVVCGTCDAVIAAADLTDIEERRMEGASDPSEMMLVVGARCPACDSKGVLVLSYGPAAGAEDSAVVVALP